MTGDGRVLVVGDVHGQLDALRRVLRRAGLIDAGDRWTGGRACLWFIGDFVDRGPKGPESIALAMRLQEEARRDGGRVEALLGNHDLLLIALRRFGRAGEVPGGGTFGEIWRRNGGVASDLEKLTAGQAEWLAARPAAALEGATLLLHADAGLYPGLAGSLGELNRAFRALVASDDPAGYDDLLIRFSEHGAFARMAGDELLDRTLETFGGKRVVHGHTPISMLTRRHPFEVVAPLIYADGRCVNVDGGLYLGGPGFVYTLS